MGRYMHTSHPDSAGHTDLVRSLFVLLIVAGIGVGVLLAMESRARQRHASLAAQKRQLETRLAFVEARHGEVLTLLGRPHTTLVKLTGARDWTGQALNVAWNPVQRLALLMIDRLPDPPAGQVYRLRAVAADGTAVSLGEVYPDAPSRVIYGVPPAVGDQVRFDVTLGNPQRDGDVVFAMTDA